MDEDDRADGALDRVMADRAIFPVFQPIVELGTRGVVGYEALARGPQGTTLYTPDRLFAAGRRAGRLAELDRLCRTRALESAGEGGFPSGRALFLNVEPDGLEAISLHESPSARWPLLDEREVQLVVEFTERALLADPARLIAFARHLRLQGVAVALVGSSPASVALMPMLRPDVVKLDMDVVQRSPDRRAAGIVTAVTAYAEESGAWVLAEGVETALHEDVVVSLGAHLAQGWRYGRPGELPGATARPSPVTPAPVLRGTAAPPPRSAQHGSRPDADGTPFAVLASRIPARRGAVPLMRAITRFIEVQAAELDGFAVVLSTFQSAEQFTDRPACHYVGLGESSALAVVFGVGMPATPVPGVRGVDVRPDDPLAREWTVVVVGPFFAAALAARERLDTGAGADREFDYVVTYSRGIVVEEAELLLGRARTRSPVAAAPPPRSSTQTDASPRPTAARETVTSSAAGAARSGQEVPDLAAGLTEALTEDLADGVAEDLAVERALFRLTRDLRPTPLFDARTEALLRSALDPCP